MSESTQFDLQPTLVGNTIKLRPLRPDDFDALFAAASDSLIWEQHPDPLRYQKPAFERFFSGALESRGALVVLECGSGCVIGSSRYYDWDARQREVAIGATFLARSHWGGATNGEMKALMLEHAFRWAEVVWFHVGVSNWRSRRAMEKIGGIYSHEARKELNGVAHDYVFFKIPAPHQPNTTISR